MKHFGSTMEYAEARIRDLMLAYDRYITTTPYVRMPDVYRTIVSQPAPRFYVSDVRAASVVGKLLEGTHPSGMRRLKFEMYLEIYRRVLNIMHKYPNKSIRDLCAKVIQEPAPCFYIEPGSAKIFICKYRKKWNQEKLKRLQRLSHHS